MSFRFAPLACAFLLAFAAGCGGQIDGSIFAAPDDASAVEDTSVLPDSAPVQDTAPGTPDSKLPPPSETGPTPPPGGAVGSPCGSNADCASGHCSGGRCTTTCTTTSDCIPGWYCSAATATKVCRCSPSGQDCGGLDKNCDGVVSSNAPCGTPIPSDAGPAPSDAAVSCTSCAQSACITEAQSCYNDPTCRNFLNCIQPCSTIPSTCVSQCANKNNSPATQAFVSCMTSNCSGCQ